MELDKKDLNARSKMVAMAVNIYRVPLQYIKLAKEIEGES
jgi:hypothetical protein